jgi:hypothetical protein
MRALTVAALLALSGLRRKDRLFLTFGGCCLLSGVSTDEGASAIVVEASYEGQFVVRGHADGCRDRRRHDASVMCCVQRLGRE